MPDLKISELPIVTTAAGDDWVVIVKGGITSRIRKGGSAEVSEIAGPRMSGGDGGREGCPLAGHPSSGRTLSRTRGGSAAL